MANQLGIIHPSMLSKLPNFYPSLCTIQNHTSTQDDYGQPADTFADLADHVNLSCRIAPEPNSRSGERDAANRTTSEHTHIVDLRGYYPNISEVHQAIVDGATYDIEAVEHDGNKVTTRMKVQVIR